MENLRIPQDYPMAHLPIFGKFLGISQGFSRKCLPLFLN